MLSRLWGGEGLYSLNELFGSGGFGGRGHSEGRKGPQQGTSLAFERYVMPRQWIDSDRNRLAQLSTHTPGGCRLGGKAAELKGTVPGYF